MTLVGVDGSTIRLQLVVESAHCVECVMPRPFLEQVALDIFRRGGVAADAVSIDDPREHPDFVDARPLRPRREFRCDCRTGWRSSPEGEAGSAPRTRAGSSPRAPR